jgi:hypothetical protein
MFFDAPKPYMMDSSSSTVAELPPKSCYLQLPTHFIFKAHFFSNITSMYSKLTLASHNPLTNQKTRNSPSYDYRRREVKLELFFPTMLFLYFNNTLLVEHCGLVACAREIKCSFEVHFPKPRVVAIPRTCVEKRLS